MPDYDVIVIGARCAGAPLAMLLAQQGRRVLAIDRAQFPSDTISTHFMWPRTTAFLAKWGLLDELAATGCPPIEKVRIHFGDATLEGRPEAVDGTAIMYCPRRTVLDALLVDAARRAGAEVRERTLMRELLRDGDRVVGVRLAGPDGVQRRARRAGRRCGRPHVRRRGTPCRRKTSVLTRRSPAVSTPTGKACRRMAWSSTCVMGATSWCSPPMTD